MENHNLKNLTTKPFAIYVRHAESEQNQIIHQSKDQYIDTLKRMYDPELTVLGRHQAKITAEYLCRMLNIYYPKVKIECWGIPFRRVSQTIKPFFDNDKVYNFSVINHYGLQEYTPESKKYPEEMCEATGIISHHDSLDQYYDQIEKLSDSIKEFLTDESREQKILIIFGHSLTFSQLLTYQSNNEKHRSQEISRIHLPNCSISVVQYDQSKTKFGGWQVYQTGSVAHLGAYATGIHTPFGMSFDKVFHMKSEIFQLKFLIICIITFLIIGLIIMLNY